MILKEKTVGNLTSAQAKAGARQEQDVAFYLRRAFKDEPSVFVFNDISFEHNDETAQIDHLIVHPYGFILIESKSITGEVRIDSVGDWSRSYKGVWSGMRSPIPQVKLQMDLLRDLLHDNRGSILGKLIFGKFQQAFGGRSWEYLCAISSNAIIDRSEAPAEIADKFFKSEFIADQVSKIIKLPKNKLAKFADSRVDFNEQELKSICDFLLANCKQNCEKSSAITVVESKPAETIEIPKQAEPEIVEATSVDKTEPLATVNFTFSCKSCGKHDQLTGVYGKYGYFAKCGHCGTNTSMKIPCPSCESKNIKVSKKAESYTLACSDCDHTAAILG